MPIDPFKPLVDLRQDPNVIEPDEETKFRIRNLGIVGTALNETYSEQNQDTGDGFFLAQEGLNNFREHVLKLNLDPPSKKGMLDLIEYLEKKIKKRIDRASGIIRPDNEYVS